MAEQFLTLASGTRPGPTDPRARRETVTVRTVEQRIEPPAIVDDRDLVDERGRGQPIGPLRLEG